MFKEQLRRMMKRISETEEKIPERQTKDDGQRYGYDLDATQHGSLGLEHGETLYPDENPAEWQYALGQMVGPWVELAKAFQAEEVWPHRESLVMFFMEYTEIVKKHSVWLHKLRGLTPTIIQSRDNLKILRFTERLLEESFELAKQRYIASLESQEE